MISLYKLHFHVHYEEVYQYKRFQKFAIKTLTKIIYPNFKNKQKTSLDTLGVKPFHRKPYLVFVHQIREEYNMLRKIEKN